ncbi:glycosyltransferase family 9 protein [Dolichospermum planctonicum CS-1226]|uniref:Glycosyltransferase family 9 protein n=1 Tax=Dolichospermum planctonicum CS-1226 TaxID=3021751 RepID=A0ABT5AEL8_9CYAN|nr:glycosyltransferase family 9 protein [Dolichospermum planctonicum]MDB9535737.1 glycosyltransferase family 9 protein [Dolichospermum planctonicum CS-1226]
MLKNPIYSNLQILKSKLAWFARKLIDFLVRIIVNKPNFEINKKKQVLIVRTDAIGDFVIFTGILPYFRELYPSQEWEITLIGTEETKTLAEFVKMNVVIAEPLFDEFIPLNRSAFIRNLTYRFQFQKNLRRILYDTVICPLYSRDIIADQLVYMTNAQEKIGIDGNCNTTLSLPIKERNDKKYTKLIKSDKVWLSEVERNINFITNMGITKLIDGLPRWKIHSDILSKSIELVKFKGVEGHFVVICPGAAISFRMWTPQKFAEVIDYLWDNYGLSILICGSPKDKTSSLEIQKSLKSAKVICLCGETNLIQLSAIMSYAKLCITMDSGSAHIAVAVNSPLICIIGGGHYKRFFPYGDPNRFRAATEELDCFYCNWNCKYDTPFCVKDITVVTVIKEIDQLMNTICNQTT